MIDPKEKSGVRSQESADEQNLELVDDAGQPVDTSERTYVAVEGLEETGPRSTDDSQQ